MDSLYIIEPGCYLRKDGDCLKIMRKKTTLQIIPAKGLEQLTLAGRTSLTGPVLDFLINNKVDTVFMTQNGRFRAHLLLDDSGHVRLRQQQYIRLGDSSSYKTQLARAVVTGKLENQVRLLLRRFPVCINELREAAVRIRALQQRIPIADSTDIIRGIEGAAARIFFSTFSFLIRNDEFVQ